MFLHISILLLFILFILIILTFLFKKEGFIPTALDKIIYYDENNNIIDHKIAEREEQEQAYKYIDRHDVVLELGGRYGTVSNVINHRLDNKEMHVVIEPDKNVYRALQKNKGNFKYKIETKYISNHPKEMIYDDYGTRLINSDISHGDISHGDISENITWTEFKEKYPLKFNVIVADCEGCLCEFIETMGDDFKNINKIIFEEDQRDMCDYELLKQNLINDGFKQIEGTNRCVFSKSY